jgi:hypothetical protein
MCADSFVPRDTRLPDSACVRVCVVGCRWQRVRQR